MVVSGKTVLEICSLLLIFIIAIRFQKNRSERCLFLVSLLGLKASLFVN